MKNKNVSEHLSVGGLAAVVANFQRNVATKQDVLTLRAAMEEGLARIHVVMQDQLGEHPLEVIELG